MLIVIFVVRRLEHSRVGRAWAAIREDEDAAELMGVPTFKFKLLGVRHRRGDRRPGRASLFASASTAPSTPTNFTLILSILFLAAVVLGGSGNIPGVILGAFLIAYLPERFRGFADYRSWSSALALVLDDDPASAGPAARAGGEPEPAKAATPDGEHARRRRRSTEHRRTTASQRQVPARAERATVAEALLELDDVDACASAAWWPSTSRSSRRAGRDLRADRPERRRQDHRAST